MIDTLTGKRVLLTGASRGIGAHIAERIGREGAALILVARDAERLGRTAERCRALGAKVEVVVADVASAADRARIVEVAGQLDVLVNNAGIENTRRLVDQTEAEVRAQIETNLVAPIELTRAVLPGMIARGRGVVVNVSSMAGKSPTPFNSVYAATKHGLNGFTASLAVELHGTGVHAGVVCPGFVSDAGMWADSGARAPALFREVSPEAVVHAVMKVISGSVEELVTPGPIRPLLALSQMAPRLQGPVLRWMGVARVLGERAAAPRR